MSLREEGKVLEIGKIETGVSKAGKEWSKIDFAIETEEQYPKTICFTLFNDRCKMLDSIDTGDKVVVDFSVESRKWTDKNGEDKWFHNVNAFFVDHASKQVSEPTTASGTPVSTFEPDNDDSLPF